MAGTYPSATSVNELQAFRGEEVLESGTRVRCGLHTGECERLGDKVGGIEFSDRGTVSLRGVPEEQQLFAVERA